MKEFISQNGGIVPAIVLVAFAFNMALSGISKALESIKDKTESKADDKAFEIISKIVSVLQKIVDWGSANRSHL